MIILDNEAPMLKNFKNFIRINNIDVLKFENEIINTDNNNNTDWMLFEENMISNIMKVLLNKNYANVLIIDKTNVIIGILRKILKWNYGMLISEYRLYAGKNSNYYSETFLEVITIKLKTNYGTFKGRNSFSSRRPSFDHLLNSGNSSTLRRLSEDVVDLDEEEDEENLLSSSPQVPKNLLRMAELRKSRKKSESMKNSSFDISIEDYNFYYPQDPFQGVKVIEITLPKEDELPNWFKFQRDLWEEEVKSKK